MTTGKYKAEIYGGRLYCGNGYFDTLGACMEWIEKETGGDGFITRAVIRELASGRTFTVAIKEK